MRIVKNDTILKNKIEELRSNNIGVIEVKIIDNEYELILVDIKGDLIQEEKTEEETIKEAIKEFNNKIMDSYKITTNKTTIKFIFKDGKEIIINTKFKHRFYGLTSKNIEVTRSKIKQFEKEFKKGNKDLLKIEIIEISVY